MNYIVVLSHKTYNYTISTKLNSPAKFVAFLQFLTNNSEYKLVEVLYGDTKTPIYGVDNEDVIKFLEFRKEDEVSA